MIKIYTFARFVKNDNTCKVFVHEVIFLQQINTNSDYYQFVATN